jgi:hypothetical protein
MDEKIRINPEQHKGHESGAESHHGRERGTEKPGARRHEHQENLEQIRTKAESQALSSETVKAVQQEDQNHQPQEAFVNKELKEMAYQRTLTRVRHQLSPLGRLTSKVVHQPLVNSVSEAVGKTVGRPSGLLGGGVTAFAGTTAYYYITKHYGYEYSFTVFLVLLVFGFLAGWTAEVLYKMFRPGK